MPVVCNSQTARTTRGPGTHTGPGTPQGPAVWPHERDERAAGRYLQSRRSNTRRTTVIRHTCREELSSRPAAKSISPVRDQVKGAYHGTAGSTEHAPQPTLSHPSLTPRPLPHDMQPLQRDGPHPPARRYRPLPVRVHSLGIRTQDHRRRSASKNIAG